MARRTLRGAKSRRGAVFFVVGLAMFGCWLVPALFSGAMSVRADPEPTRAAATVGLLVFCVASAILQGENRAIYFSPSEVEFLFAGPFTRRELLVFKMTKQVSAAIFNALIFSVAFLRFTPRWAAGFVGFFLALVFVQLFSMALVLAAQTVTARAYSRVRQIVLGLVIVLVLVGVVYALGGEAREGLMDRVRRFQHSWAGTVVLAPFDVFSRTIVAQSWFPSLVGWGALAAAINVGLMGLVIGLDANYLEAAAAASQKLYERRQRAQRGGPMAAASSRGPARFHLPQLPWLGGAGPVAWRQLTTGARSSRAMVWLLLLMAIFMGPTVLRTQTGESPAVVAMVGVWLLILFPQFFRFDFRGDLDQMEWLKMLPVKSSAIAVGELIAPVAGLTVVQVMLVGGFAVFAGAPSLVLAGAAVFALPLSLLVFGVENMIFLVWPSRAAASSPGDLQFIGRLMLVMIVKMLVVGGCCGVAALAGFVAYWVFGRSWAAGLVVGWLVVSVLAVGTVPGVAWAFRRFDVSTDMPA